ncbi:formate dehydrogenase accessory sulfurtransferase FdhD [Actinoallomurus soli]|uniref:formate dehydrogenase accessory sulfurtransferase FdhD n=1 Tax=Actinoallomurus soli TaxID=2952535 RepID=UPI0020937E02|nr:formate dehydrogenase accessory sulfurtransferase FdhD [Actinoallomurus soli]MCO5974305.1 formate dehydrogenase accessory sulfurtransferase FdhD [Actinoallomurus soli]
MGRVTVRRRIAHIDEGGRRARPDTLVVEEPLEIRLGGHPLSVTMRTPGNDFDLVTGFLYAEGVIRAPEDVAAMRYCADTDTFNVVDVALAAEVAPPEVSVERSFYTTSACGVCGKTSIDALRQRARHDIRSDTTVLDPDVLAALPDALREAQRVFERTGGLHAAGLFDASGTLVVLREDVGRHNAVDKVVGWALKDGRLPLAGHVLLVSGRASFELTQKAMLAGIPALAAVSAPSSLAAELAEEAGMTLVGFLRGHSMNVYTGAERIKD